FSIQLQAPEKSRCFIDSVAVGIYRIEPSLQELSMMVIGAEE
ncbi:hypothetical protein APX70_01622, partial [Pseudomonas syringae pv. maculicola]